MFRDGARKSAWQNEVKWYGTVFSKDREFDAVIIGGGITGISTALKLQQKGLKCLLLEANNIGFGTTGGTTAHLNDFFDTTFSYAIAKFGLEKAQLLAQAGREGLRTVHMNVAEYGIECDYEGKTAELFALGEEQANQLAEIVDGARKIGYEMNYTDSIEYPFHFERAVSIPGQAQFHPVKYITALADIFVANGGALAENCLCSSFNETSEGVVLETGLGEIRAKNAVFATHTPPGISLLHFTCAPYRSYVIAFTLREGTFPTTLGYDLGDPYHYYRVHEIDGKKMIIAGGEDHKTGHSDDTGACFSRLEDHCRKHFPVDQVEYAWSSQYFEPIDGLPSIGVLPSSDGRIYVATGFRGNGMTFGSLSSGILTDLITEGASKYKEIFDPKRFKPNAGFSNLLKENATVLKDLLVDKIWMERVRSLADIGSGQAKVVKHQGNSYAIFAEQNGKLHVLRSTCPHANCEVRWNNAELSWDCPCHGSRFNVNGKILNGPSTTPLEQITDPEL
ncbi:FAD-dependent oxidoreductase [Sphingobacterium sp.]|uniref:FAD-dependent oxidoreductase n=1 Tax=Sphingobacterium sp. TaxID=341027 RepID=UPI0028A990EB|nr:FAD-dependent oxidoreductase [Sphingobacterium sp.]